MTEYRLIMAVVIVLCGLGAASAFWPVIDAITTTAVIGAVALAGLVNLTRITVRELRFWRDMRAFDRRDAALAAARAAREQVLR